MQTQVHSNLVVNGSVTLAQNLTEFPSNPAIGTLVIKDQCLYGYIRIGTLETWYPFATKTRSYIHSQGIAATTWTVTHNLGSTKLWVQVQDQTGDIIHVKTTTVDSNTITVSFTSASVGTVLVVAPDSIDVPELKANVFTIGNNVVIDSSGVRVNGSYVLTSANITQDIQQQVDAEATVRAAADASLRTLIDQESTIRENSNTSLRDAVNSEITLRSNADILLQTAIDAETTARVALSNSVSQSLEGKQDLLVSGTNLKTINNTTLLGSSNISLPTLAANTYTGKQVATEFEASVVDSSIYIESYVPTVSAAGNVNLDLSQGGVFELNLVGDTLITVSNPPTLTNEILAFVVKINQSSVSRTVTWFSNVTWLVEGGAPAAPDANKSAEYIFTTVDGINFTGRKGAFN